MDNNQNNGPENNNQGPKNSQTIMIFLVVTVIIFCVMMLFNRTIHGTSSNEITYTEFMNMLDTNRVAEVVIEADKYKITPRTLSDVLPVLGLKGDDITYYTGIVDDPDLPQKLLDKGVPFKRTIPDITGPLIYNILSFILPLLFIWGLMFLLMKKMGGGGGGIMGIGKNKARVYAQKETGVTFADVAGQEEAKESLQEVVDFLENPGKYTQIGAKLPKGALLVGPPGTGKTLLAKAVAGEAHCPFFSLSGSEFVEMFVGVGASRVRELFEEAKKNAPCIIFIDEIDAIGKSRDTVYGGGNDEREQTLNQLLAEMDGFDSQSGLLLLGATNRPEVLDQALLRPGRFDRRVIVDRPDLQGRIDVLKVHSKNVHMDETVDLEAIALATSGAVGSDLANMINEAAILAVKKGRRAVSQADLFESVEVVIAGKEKKNQILSAEERRIVSYHEVGHALISALQKDSEPVQKITIVPRTMGSLGYVLNVPEEERHLQNKDELLALLKEYVGGRAAEEIVFGKITTGAANDIEKATNIAKAMITQFGMSDKFGMVNLVNKEGQYLGGRTVLNCSEQTSAEIDAEVRRMIHEAYDEALTMLREHREALDKIAEFLIEKETITGKEFMDILHKIEKPEEAVAEEPAAEEATPVEAVVETVVDEQVHAEEKVEEPTAVEGAEQAVVTAEEAQAPEAAPEVKAVEEPAEVAVEETAVKTEE